MLPNLTHKGVRHHQRLHVVRHFSALQLHPTKASPSLLGVLPHKEGSFPFNRPVQFQSTIQWNEVCTKYNLYLFSSYCVESCIQVDGQTSMTSPVCMHIMCTIQRLHNLITPTKHNLISLTWHNATQPNLTQTQTLPQPDSCIPWAAFALLGAPPCNGLAITTVDSAPSSMFTPHGGLPPVMDMLHLGNPVMHHTMSPGGHHVITVGVSALSNGLALHGSLLLVVNLLHMGNNVVQQTRSCQGTSSALLNGIPKPVIGEPSQCTSWKTLPMQTKLNLTQLNLIYLTQLP